MILTALMHRERRLADGVAEMHALVGDIIDACKGERVEEVNGTPYKVVGNVAEFTLSESADGVKTNSLKIAINKTTGYGALIWFVTAQFPKKGGIYDRVWVSNNQQPPGFDTRVASDPWDPDFHDPRSTLPLASVRAAVEEFCRTGTGDRPECIDWVEASSFSGDRADT